MFQIFQTTELLWSGALESFVVKLNPESSSVVDNGQTRDNTKEENINDVYSTLDEVPSNSKEDNSLLGTADSTIGELVNNRNTGNDRGRKFHTEVDIDLSTARGDHPSNSGEITSLRMKSEPELHNGSSGSTTGHFESLFPNKNVGHRSFLEVPILVTEWIFVRSIDLILALVKTGSTMNMTEW